MKVAYITAVQMPVEASGQSTQIQAMARAFNSKLGKDFLLVSPKNKINENLQTLFLWKKISILNNRLKSLKQAIFILKSLPILLKFKPNFVYTRNIAIALAFKVLGFKTVYEAHQAFNTRTGDFLFRLVNNKIRVVAISQALKDFLIKKYSILGNNILVAHDGVFLGEFESVVELKRELREKYIKQSEKDFVVLYWGSLATGKGVDLVLQSAKQLPEIKFVLIGGTDTQIEGLKSKYSNLNNVSFLGIKPHDKMPYFTKGADLLILPNTKKLSYWRFTSPLKMFEYMASRVPIITSALGSISEILNNSNSILFKSEDANDLGSKISWVKDNYGEALKKSDQALEDAKQYAWPERIENILEFLKN